MTPTPGVPEILARTRDAIAPAMVAAVERLEPDTRLQASYHLGWADANGRPTGAPAGKGIRPALALLSASAAWSDPSVGIPGAVAVELVHNFSLIHDDIIDEDLERHHRPTVWSVFGVGSAIITGDALQVLAHQLLLEASETYGAAASAALAEGTAAMIAGQALDVAFEKRRNVSVEECMAMSAAKTGALLGCASSIGALLAGAPPATVGALRDFGCQLGLAFQAVDDLLGIWGDPAVTGKPAGNDLRQRKKSMPVVAALAAGGDDADELRELVLGPAPGEAQRADALAPAAEQGPLEAEVLEPAELDGEASPVEASARSALAGTVQAPVARPSVLAPSPAAGHPPALPPLDADQVARAALLVERCGGREWTAVRAKAHLDAALGALQRVRLSAVPHRELADLAVFVVEREA